MNREQLLATLAILAVLSAAIQQFYTLKAEVAEIRVHLQYLTGANWHPPQEQHP